MQTFLIHRNLSLQSGHVFVVYNKKTYHINLFLQFFFQLDYRIETLWNKCPEIYEKTIHIDQQNR